MIEVRQCPVCHNQNSKVYLKAKKSIIRPEISSENYSCTSFDHSFASDILECLSCKHIYSSSVPDFSSLSSFYAGVEDSVYLREKEARLLTFQYYLEEVLKQTSLKDKSILEIGSYYGGFLEAAKERGYSVTGIEPSTHASTYCRQNGFDVKSGLLENWNAQGQQFDVIVFWDVFEHITDPHPFLNKINSLLKKDGMIFFSTMDTHGIVPRVMRRHWPWFMTMHVNYYHKKTLERVLTEHGFQITQLYHHPHIVSLDYLFTKLEKMYRPTRWLFSFLKKIKSIQKMKVPFNAFDNYLIVAKNCQQ